MDLRNEVRARLSMSVRALVLWTDLRRGICMRRVLKCAFAYDRV